MNQQSDYWKQKGLEFDKETDLSVFKTWPSVLSVPLYSYDEFFNEYAKEVKDMIKILNGRGQWTKLLNESKIGHTDESYTRAMKEISPGVMASSNTLKNVHHILSFESLTGKDITKYDAIVEMGAGLGEVARMIHMLGFVGEYYILDLPQVSRISKYYLKNSVENAIGYQDSVKYISDIKDVPLEIPVMDREISRSAKILFIGIWSISETPYEYRDAISSYFKEKDFFFVAQRQIWEYDNFDYFMNRFPRVSNTWLRTRAISWHPGDGGNVYIAATG
jgi:hypothetical protein